MTPDKEAKLRLFMNDHRMSEAVFESIIHGFLFHTRFTADIELLAASRMAITLLENVWKDLETFRRAELVEGKSNSQVGL